MIYRSLLNLSVKIRIVCKSVCGYTYDVLRLLTRTGRPERERESTARVVATSPAQLFTVSQQWTVDWLGPRDSRDTTETQSSSSWMVLIRMVSPRPGTGTSTSASLRCVTFVLTSCTASYTTCPNLQHQTLVMRDSHFLSHGKLGETKDSGVSSL